ncbi:diguanylate cyclase [Leeia sp.]|uniref:sensor domain-containing diguanylate cyclase n=1 Tax=Leeia sp. TaxID=2884678 RepID=UPI0035AF7376
MRHGQFARRFILSVTMISVLPLLLVMLAYGSFWYVESKEALERQLHKAKQLVPMMQKAWRLNDVAALHDQIDRILLVDGVVAVSWLDREQQRGVIQRAGFVVPDKAAHQEALLNEQGEQIGRIDIYTDLAAMPQNPWRELREGVVWIVATWLVLLIVLNWRFRSWVCQPLLQLSRYVEKGGLQDKPEPFSWQRHGGSSEDELDVLARELVALKQTAYQHVQQEKMGQSVLAEERDRLRSQVVARTHELDYLSRFQRLIGNLFQRFAVMPMSAVEAGLQQALAEVGRFLCVERVSLFQHDPELSHMRYTHEWVEEGFLPTIELLDEVNTRNFPWWMAQLQQGRVLQVDDPLQLPPEARAERDTLMAHGVRSLICMPLLSSEGLMGYITYDALRQPRRWSQEELTLLGITNTLFLSILLYQRRELQLEAARRSLEQYNRKLEMLSRSDELTGLANRRHFNEVRAQEFRRALRDNLPLTLLLFDLDYFKAYNDSLGHAAGDDALKVFADCLKQTFERGTDLVARVGGEEFAVLLPATATPQGVALAERLRATLQARQVNHPNSPVADCLTVSIGLVTLDPERHPDVDALYTAADRALYEAKALGRNRVVSA